MQMVIEIDDIAFQGILRLVSAGEGSASDIAIASGTPLPKGHGRLIDADAIDWFKGEDENGNPCYILDKRDLSLEPTILEADKESENGK